MSVSQHTHSVKVTGIAEQISLVRLEDFLKRRYSQVFIKGVDTQKTPEVYQFSTGPLDGPELHVRIYTTGSIVLQASSQLPKGVFDCHSKAIESFAHAAVNRVRSGGNFQLARAGELLHHIDSLSEEKETDRMVMVLLADTIVEIMLRETLKASDSSSKALNAPVPTKLDAIEANGGQVYLKDAISSLRNLRNNVAHQGQLPSQQQAHSALETARQVLTHGCRE